MGNESKIVKYIDLKELPDFFRNLADALEQGNSDEFPCVEDCIKFKISGKNEFGKISVKGKFKSGKECVPDVDGMQSDGSPAKPKYKSLKKRMKQSFRMLVKLIHDGQMPPDEAVVSFLEDSALMVSYPGYGDEYYEDYTRACEAFREAHESGDMGRMHETIDVLVHEKSRCHAKYD
ncbi:GAK system XXXCH domain-containing protein [Pseudodesulfovibrio piezophilus]|uniref:GAK system XXXCH domain-containing protein n=1 Tax=Pseudodesulfovibrio piezophilus (strain DSM 21447 / JCM 15486 / C1TLV30) TaxID=1322246 RepID=M1WX03_PSEP2|nr:GAK system XXXCH domain-containing protein [Pseudodesulfovibrio piezophilus]CCH49423.1 conserved protein of unknown function [Pseudodesulfovibrio piezophilus C1TLV30]